MHVMAIFSKGLASPVYSDGCPSLSWKRASRNHTNSKLFSHLYSNIQIVPFCLRQYSEVLFSLLINYHNIKDGTSHGVNYHSEGFGSPVGKLKGINLAIENMYPKDLEAYGIFEGQKKQLIFEGELIIEGEIITGKRDLQGKILLISFKPPDPSLAMTLIVISSLIKLKKF